MSYQSLTQFNTNNSSSKSTMVPTYDWNEFLCDLEEMYNEFKKMSGEMTERTRHVLGEKFSGTFQNKYAQLSVKFDSLIERAQSKFESHRGVLQDTQQHVSQLLSLLPGEQCYGQLLTIVSQLLLSSQSLYQEYIKQEVFTIKQELETIVIKNYELQQEITRVYESYEQVKQRLDEEMNYRFELQKHLVSLQKQIVGIKQQNYELNKVNTSLIKSKHDLNQQVEVTKQQHKILKKSQLQKFDKLKQQQIKTKQLQKQNQLLQHQIFTLQHQLQQNKNQQENFIEEIKHLTEIIDNQSYQLQFYKNRQLRQSPSLKMQSHDKLNKYQDLILQNYYPQQSSQKSSLRSFMLSHQKSMGKLTIFQTRQHHQQRVLQKISSCQKSLHSYQRQNNYHIDHAIQRESDRSMIMQGLGFPLLENQMTFRPGKDNEMRQQDLRWTEKRRQVKNNRQQQQVVLAEPQILIKKDNQQVCSPQQKKYPKTSQDYPYIQPLVISGRKNNHSRQRSLSITEGYPSSSTSFSVSKKLLYESDQIPQNGSNENKDRIQQMAHGDGDTSMIQSQNDRQKDKSVNMKNVKQHKSNNASSVIYSQQENNNKAPYVRMNSNFYLTRRKQQQPQIEKHFPPLLKKRLLPKTQSKKEFHQSQPINISQLLYRKDRSNLLDRNNEDVSKKDFMVKNNNNSFITNNNNNNSFITNTNNNNSLMNSNNNSRINIVTPQWDNKSESNSVNRALIKKNIKAQREMDELIERLEKVEIKNDEYQENINELEYKLEYYKEQLSKTSIQCINFKSTIQSLQSEISILQKNVIDLQQRQKNKDNQIQQKNRYIEQMLKQLQQLNQGLLKAQSRYEERLMKVKQHCKQYIQKKHQQEINSIIDCYQNQLNKLQKQLQQINKQQKQQKQQYLQYQRIQKIDIAIATQQLVIVNHISIATQYFLNTKDVEIGTQYLINVKDVEIQTQQLINSKEIAVGTQQQKIQLKDVTTQTQLSTINCKDISIGTEQLIISIDISVGTQQFINRRDIAIGNDQTMNVNDISVGTEQFMINKDIGIGNNQCINSREIAIGNEQFISTKDVLIGTQQLISLQIESQLLSVFIKPKQKQTLIQQKQTLIQQKQTLVENKRLSIEQKVIDVNFNLLLQTPNKKNKLQYYSQTVHSITIYGVRQIKPFKQLTICSQQLNIALQYQVQKTQSLQKIQQLQYNQSSFKSINKINNYKLTINSNIFSLKINHSQQQINPIKSPTLNDIISPILNPINSPLLNNIKSPSLNTNESPFFNINKSPSSLQKKQIVLNTPSTQSYLQSYKPTTNKSQQQQQQSLVQQQNESFHTVQFILKKQSLIDSSSYISSNNKLVNISSSNILKEQQMDDFFTCIQLSNQSIAEINTSNSFISKNYTNNKSNSQNKNNSNTYNKSRSCQYQILPKDILLVKNCTSYSHQYQDNLPSVIQQQNLSNLLQNQKEIQSLYHPISSQYHPNQIYTQSEILQQQTQKYQLQQNHECKQQENNKYQQQEHIKYQQQQLEQIGYKKQEHIKYRKQQQKQLKQNKVSQQLFKVFNPSKVNQFVQIQQPQIITRSRASSKHLKKHKQPYFKITLSKEKSLQDNQNQQQFYSKSFQQHLTSYYKKHTNFIFTNNFIKQGIVPDIQRMYILHTSRISLIDDGDKQNVQNLQTNNHLNRFLLHKRVLVNLQNNHKLQLPKSSMLKFITDDNRLVLGNFQIIITSDPYLKISRKNKRSFYIGQLQDAIYQINSIQQVIPLVNTQKKSTKI